MTEQEMQFELMKSKEKVNDLQQEVASMNKEREFWQQVHIQASIAAMYGALANPYCSQVQLDSGVPFCQFHAINAVQVADALVEELKKGGQDE